MTSTAAPARHAGRTRWLKRSLGLLLATAAFGYLAVGAYIYAVQRSMLFVPDRSDVSGEVGRLPGAEALKLTTSDGETINAWYKPPRDEGKPIYLYLHGNGANLTRRAGRFRQMTEDGAGLLAVSWRGYGGSTGSPSEHGLRNDALAAYTFITSRMSPARLVLFGESLGTGVAIWLAATRPAALLVLDSPFASIADLGAMRFPWLPVALMSRDPFWSIRLAPQVRIPVIAQHCTSDWLIPLREAQRLMAAFPAAPDLGIIDGRCHVPDVGRVLLPRVRAWIRAGS